MQRFDILGVGVDAIGKQALREKIVLAAKALGKTIFAYVNIHALNVAHVNAGFRRFLSDADVVYCDGEGIRLAANLLGFHLPPRIVLTTRTERSRTSSCSPNKKGIFGSDCLTLSDVSIFVSVGDDGLLWTLFWELPI